MSRPAWLRAWWWLTFVPGLPSCPRTGRHHWEMVGWEGASCVQRCRCGVEVAFEFEWTEGQ